MSATTQKLTREAFREIYADQKPNWELIDGEPEQKALGSKRHSFLQLILGQMLTELGFRTGVELTLEISDDWEPLPDVAGMLGPDTDAVYQNSPPAVVIEILSPSDRFSTLMRKCQRYADWGVLDILVFDPVQSEAWFWDDEQGTLLPLIASSDEPSAEYDYHFENGAVLDIGEVWRRLKEKMES